MRVRSAVSGWLLYSRLRAIIDQHEAGERNIPFGQGEAQRANAVAHA
jgi:hypothetical protein